MLVLSVRFALAEKVSPFSTIVHEFVGSNDYFRSMNIYNPNAVCKSFCGPKDEFVALGNPCRGLCGMQCKHPDRCSLHCALKAKEFKPCDKVRVRGYDGSVTQIDSSGDLVVGFDNKTLETCAASSVMKLFPEPTGHSCWRYSFRWHQQKAKDSNGFMLQVRERPYNSISESYFGKLELGQGQVLEELMAQEVGLDTFRIDMPNNWNSKKRQQVLTLVDSVAAAIRSQRT